MREPTIRLARLLDKEGNFTDEGRLALEWFQANREQSHLDEKMLTYPGTKILTADPLDGSHPWLFAPIHPTYILDSLAPNPNVDDARIGLALRKITEIAKWEAQSLGAGTVHFVPSEPRIEKFAARHENFFPVSMLRKELY